MSSVCSYALYVRDSKSQQQQDVCFKSRAYNVWKRQILNRERAVEQSICARGHGRDAAEREIFEQ